MAGESLAKKARRPEPAALSRIARPRRKSVGLLWEPPTQSCHYGSHGSVRYAGLVVGLRRLDAWLTRFVETLESW